MEYEEEIIDMYKSLTAHLAQCEFRLEMIDTQLKQLKELGEFLETPWAEDPLAAIHAAEYYIDKVRTLLIKKIVEKMEEVDQKLDELEEEI